MENYSNQAYPPYGGYRGAATAQPLAAPKDLPAGSPESYHPLLREDTSSKSSSLARSSPMGTSSRTLLLLPAIAVLLKGPRWGGERVLPVG